MKSITRAFRILKVKPFILLALPLLFTLQSCRRNTDSRYSVKHGHFVQSVVETGELRAVNASFLSMPRINYIYGYSFKLIRLSDHGSNVHKGDTVFMVDPSAVQKFIIERSEALENEVAASNKLKAQITNNLQDLNSQFRNEESLWSLKKLAMERSGFEAVSIRKTSELEFRQEDIKLNKIKRNLEIKPRLDSLDLRIQNIRIKQKEAELEAAREDLSKMIVMSPLDGIFVVGENWRNGQTIRVGDELYLGNPVAQIPDIRTMKVQGFIQEDDISRIRTGADVVVRLDALPSVPFHGKLAKIGKVCIERDSKRIFLTEVLISESDPRLKPGMTVSCEYITYEGNDETFVPNNCIKEEGRRFYVFVLRRGKTHRTEVKPGLSNNMFTIVKGDLKPGQPLEIPGNIQ
jgi:multidrug efflux pump subunit AcrA (membrane-fusion protein)